MIAKPHEPPKLFYIFSTHLVRMMRVGVSDLEQRGVLRREAAEELRRRVEAAGGELRLSLRELLRLAGL